MPLLQGLFGELGEVPLVAVFRNLAPRRRVVEHQADALRRFWERGVHRRGEGVDELRPSGVVEPEEATAESAEVALRRAHLDLPRLPDIVELRVVDAQGLALYLQGLRIRAQVDRVASTPRRLAADGAVAGLVWVR